MLTAEVIDVTITGRKDPLVMPEKVTSVVLPTGLTVIVASKDEFVIAPMYIAAEFIPVVGNALTVPTVVAKSG
jgi:hypothetical protein